MNINSKRKVVTSIGMFDLLKGIAMLLIVLAHNRSVFPSLSLDVITRYSDSGFVKLMPYVYGASLVGRGIFAIIVAVLIAQMPALLIIAGYSIRKQAIKKNVRTQSKELVKPYLITTFATVLMNVILHYAFFRYLPGALSESSKVLGGMLLGLSQTQQFGSITLYANGPIWFLLTMFWSLVLFNCLLNFADEKKIWLYVLVLSLLGWLLSYIKYTPFCLSQGLVGVVYVYMGYYLKKTKALTKEYDLKSIKIYVIAVIIPNIVLAFFGLVTEMADNVYSLGPISYIENGLLGIGVLYVFLRINSVVRGRTVKALRYIGRYSFYVMCVHTVEMIAVPWYVVAEAFGEHQVAGFFILYLFRLLIIAIGCFLVIKFVESKKKKKLIKSRD